MLDHYLNRSFLKFSHYAVLVIAFLVSAMGCLQSAQAKIIEPSLRVELVDEVNRFDITNHIYITQIVDQSLNYKAMLQRYRNGQRGEKQNGDFIDLGHTGHAAWLVFSATNTSQTDQWVLDLGGAFEGRMGFVETLFVRNDTTRQTFIRFDGDKSKLANSAKYHDGQIPIILPKGQTSTIVIALKMQEGMPASIRPKILSYDAAQMRVSFDSAVKNILIVLFVFMAGIFVSLSYVRSNVTYFWYALYYVVQTSIVLVIAQGMVPEFWASVFSLNCLVFAGLALAVLVNKEFLKLGEDDAFWTRVSAGLGTLFAILAVVGSFMVVDQPAIFVFVLHSLLPAIGILTLAFMAYKKARYGYYGAYALSASWCILAIGFLLSGLATMKMTGIQSVLVYAYWIALTPQAALFVFASVSKIKNLMAEERQGYIKKSEEAMAQARDIQARESEDQAKLLRVIERERELMAGLRELEVHRAEEMRIAKDEADEANRAKSAFLAVVSHEVRTPMTGILGMVRLLLDSKLNEKQHEYVMAVQNSGESMMALLNDILDFEKIQTGNLALEYIDFDLPQLVNGVVTLMSGHAAEKGIQLKSDIEISAPRIVNGDPTRLRQVILNFVNNAIKFTDQGSVTVKVQRGASAEGDDRVPVYVGIEDTGIGISEEAQKTLFDPFSQADSSTTRKYGGTGLGLTICQKLIEAMGSQIDLKSVPDQGSTFSFTLSMELGDEKHNAGDAESGRAVSQEIEVSNGRSLNILVVEDNEMNQKVLKGFLEPQGHRLTLLDNAEDAIGLCKSVYGVESEPQQGAEPYDCVLMDMQLPGMNGKEATRVFRSYDSDAFQNLPIIALTGNVHMDDVRSYYQCGMNGFLAKPIDHQSLLDMLEKVEMGTLQAPDIEPLSQEQPVVMSDIPDEDGDFMEEIAVAPILSEALQLEQGTPQSVEEGELLDMMMLDSLSANLGKDQCIELMAGFMEKNEELVQTLQATQSDDFQTLNAKAHELKGMAANFGLKALSDVADIIEKGAKDEDADMVASGVSQIQSRFVSSKAALDDWLSQL